MLHFILVTLVFVAPSQLSLGSLKIDIIDTGRISYAVTEFRVPGSVGAQESVLNLHYYPGINAYTAGQYSDAYAQFTYMIKNASFWDGHPYQSHFIGTSHHLRGMILVYHAQGAGRLTLAKSEFEAAIRWNPKNYIAHLELSRVLRNTGLTDQAKSMLEHLIGLNPDKETLEEAQMELDALDSRNPQ
jgi:tetratricopeptide (TPR) repeat protein